MSRATFFRDEWGYLRGWSFGIVFASVVVLILGIIVVGIDAATRHACYETAERMGLDARYSFWTPCLVEVREGVWVDLDAISVNDLGGIE
jgi:hypothetical protein